MEFTMDFIVDNYLWFAIGGIAILMIIIGYFAEKTDFGRKPLRNKENKKEELPEENNLPVENMEVTEEVVESPAMEEDLSAPLTADEFQMPEDVVEDVNETLIPDVEETEQVEDTPIIEEDLNVPFGDPQTDNGEQDVIEEIEEPIAEQVEEDSSEDDVWKF